MADGHNPLDQFAVKTLVPVPSLGGYNIDFTNASLWMVVAVVGVYLFMTLGMRGRALVPGRWQSLVEMTYQFIASTVRDTVGNEGKAYFPFIFTLFMFILFSNLFGLFPGAFTVTSHIIVTFAMAAIIFVGLTIVAIKKHGLMAFITRFCPPGLPKALAILMWPIELLSFLARPISLSVRLAANMVAGHVMLKVFAGFIVTLLAAGGGAAIVSALPFTFMVILSGFEFGVALLQAYIFTVLTCIYLSDVLHAH